MDIIFKNWHRNVNAHLETTICWIGPAYYLPDIFGEQLERELYINSNSIAEIKNSHLRIVKNI